MNWKNLYNSVILCQDLCLYGCRMFVCFSRTQQIMSELDLAWVLNQLSLVYGYGASKLSY